MAEPRVPRLERPFFAAESREFWVRVSTSRISLLRSNRKCPLIQYQMSPIKSAQIALMRLLCFIVHR